MPQKISPSEISILLTCTIDVQGIAQMERSDTSVRLSDYQQALKLWLDDPWIQNVIFVENSGYPLDIFAKQVQEHRSGKNIEFLSFFGQNFPRHLGKGYGEALALRHVEQNSQQLRATGRFLKVNGRYYVANINKVLDCMKSNTSVFCNLNKSMTYSDSRVFGGDLDFLNYVCQQGLNVDDSQGHWLEHQLSKAALHAIADGKSWQFIRNLPVIRGVSGTGNKNYNEPGYKRILKGFAHSAKQYLMHW